ncbi:MAG: phosphotransferase [bacterium]|nr:phosphotransferase [bacterium]
MNKNIYILPVSATFRDIHYPDPIIRNPKDLESKVKTKFPSFKMGKSLSASDKVKVFEGTIDKQKVVVKHTENTEPKLPVDYLIMNESHDAEVRVLKRLATEQHIRVPQLIENMDKITTLVMEDLRVDGFVNLSQLILKKNINMKSAKHIGSSLAHLIQISREWEEFKTNESAQLSFYERSLEMLLAYPNDLKRHKKLESQFTQYAQEKEEQDKKPRHFVWPDSHPKNMLINKNGEVTFLDFGRCHWGDQNYMLPNFLAHIVLYSLTKHIPKSKAIKYAEVCIKAYKDIEPIEDEGIFAQYLAMELFHSANGRFVEGITKKEHKISAQSLGLAILDGNIKSIKKLIQLIKKAK